MLGLVGEMHGVQRKLDALDDHRRPEPQAVVAHGQDKEGYSHDHVEDQGGQDRNVLPAPQLECGTRDRRQAVYRGAVAFCGPALQPRENARADQRAVGEDQRQHVRKKARL
ncbi:MAG: hypothetical protein WDM92_05205 [Caulobacteraceae bacterium]